MQCIVGVMRICGNIIANEVIYTIWPISSIGRAPHCPCGGNRFETGIGRQSYFKDLFSKQCIDLRNRKAEDPVISPISISGDALDL